MNKTIRDHVKARVRLGQAIVFASFLGMALYLIYWTPPKGQFPASILDAAKGHIPMSLAVFATVISVAGTLPSLIKCPRCEVGFGRAAKRIGARLWLPAVDRCPHCGVSLDDPYTRGP